MFTVNRSREENRPVCARVRVCVWTGLMFMFPVSRLNIEIINQTLVLIDQDQDQD